MWIGHSMRPVNPKRTRSVSLYSPRTRSDGIMKRALSQ